MALDPTALTRLGEHAAAHDIDLASFWAAIQMLNDQGVIDPTPELAKRIMWRLGTGQQFDEALRISTDEALEESRRNSL